MRLNPAVFNRHLAGMGQQVRWRKAYACACVNPATGNPDPKHSLCLGKGRLWDTGLQTVVGIVRQDTMAEWVQSGLYESGDMVLSVGSDSPMWADAGQYDRLVLLNSDDVFSQPLVRGAPTERLVFIPVSIDRVFWLSPDKQSTIEGGIPVWDANGNLTWPNGGAPPLGATYSVTGKKQTEYFIWGRFPSDRNEHSGAPLPKRLIARKWDLYGR